MALGPYPDLGALAAAIAGALCSGPDAPVGGNNVIVAQLVERGIRENFRVEEEIEKEAEATLRELGSAAGGMDRDKLLGGIRERIAKKKGFVR